MKREEPGPFRFKGFEVRHLRSSMRIGIDAVLIGAWGDVKGERGLDAGCGCGVIAMMAAQRNEHARLIALDVDKDSIEEASLNFHSSPFSQRLDAVEADVLRFVSAPQNSESFDFILSNPPFFRSGVKEPTTSREVARHQNSLSPFSLLSIAEKALKPSGTLSMIFPHEFEEEIIVEAQHLNLNALRICEVSDRPSKSPKRIMVTLIKSNAPAECRRTELFIRDEDGEYSEAYKTLTSDFYLNF